MKIVLRLFVGDQGDMVTLSNADPVRARRQGHWYSG